MGLNA